jgi:DNA repair exonuclease SbcCD nuclease subunit
MKTARFLGEQLRRLDAAGIDVFVIRGNHDPCPGSRRSSFFRKTFTCTAGAPKRLK